MLFAVGAGVVLGMVACQSDSGTAPTAVGLQETDDPYFNVEGPVYDDSGAVVNCKVEVQVNFIETDTFYTMKTVYTDEYGHFEALNVQPSGEWTRVKFTHPNTAVKISDVWTTEDYATYSVYCDFSLTPSP